MKIIVLNGFCLSLIFSYPAWSQTQEEIDYVTKAMKRPQTKSSTLSFFAGLYEGQGQYAKAIEYYKKMQDIYAADPGLGPTSVKYAWLLTKLAICYKASGNTNEALSLCKRAVSIVGDRTPENSPIEVNYLNGVAENCKIVLGSVPLPKSPAKLIAPVTELQGIPSSEITNLDTQELVAIQSAQSAMRYGTDSHEYLKELLYLANILTLKKKYTDAEPLFKKIIGQVEEKRGAETQMLLVPLSNYGYMLKQSGRTAEADSILERIKRINSLDGRPATTI